MYLYGAHIIKWAILRLLTPSFSDYRAFKKVRIMSSTKRLNRWEVLVLMSIEMLICWAVLIVIAKSLSDKE